MSIYQSNSADCAGVRVVDLRSDTVTVPTAEMRKAMAEAAVGDDVYGEDPTVKALEETAASLLGKEAGLFVPSGTMGNLLAFMVHCNQRGSEAIVGTQAHSFLYEQGGAAHLAGVSLNLIQNKPDGTFDLDEFEQKVRGFDIHEPKTQLVMVENTHNMCGGKVLPLEWLEQLSKRARAHGLKIHMDGARVFNAAAYMNVPVSRIARDVDTVCFCLSKGLSCPVGSLLVGSKEFIKEAHRGRKALGGGMRQVGILAAAGLVALEQVVPLLGDDHKRAKRLAQAIYALNSKNFTVDMKVVQTNIFMIELLNSKIKSSDLTERLGRVEAAEIAAGVVDENRKGIIVKCGARDWSFVRAVTHIQIDDQQIDLAIKKFAYVIKEFDEKY